MFPWQHQGLGLGGPVTPLLLPPSLSPPTPPWRPAASRRCGGGAGGAGIDQGGTQAVVGVR